MKAGSIVIFASLAGLSTAASKTIKWWAACELSAGVGLPPFPDAAFVDEYGSNAPAGSSSKVVKARNAARQHIFGSANPAAADSLLPHWYTNDIWDPTGPANAPVKVSKVASSVQFPARSPAEQAAYDALDPAAKKTAKMERYRGWNIDHVFEHVVFRQYISAKLGFGDRTTLADGADIKTAATDAECKHWQEQNDRLPSWYSKLKNPPKGLLDTIYKHVQGLDPTFPLRRPSGEFAGLDANLNRYKGLVFSGRIAYYWNKPEHSPVDNDAFPDADRSFFKGTTKKMLEGRMKDIESLTNVFEFMKRPEIIEIYARTCRRFSTVLHGVDYYLDRGNKAALTDGPKSFKNSKGAEYPSLGGGFEAWLKAYLNFVTGQTRLLMGVLIKTLEDDLNDATVKATNKAAVSARLTAFKALNRHTNAFLTLPINQLVDVVADHTDMTVIFHVNDDSTSTTKLSPFLYQPFGDKPYPA